MITRNPERVAWITLSLAFTAFCLLAVVIPLGVRWQLLYAEREQRASVESLVGTVVVEPSVGRGPIPLGKGQSTEVREGTTIRVDETAEAAITFFDHSFMRLFSGTTVRIDGLREPRYAFGRQPISVQLTLVTGRVQIGTALSPDRPLDFRATTIHCESVLDPDGSYALEENNVRSEITTYRGRARILAAGAEEILTARQRTQVELNQPPQPAMGVARDLIINGDFQESLNVGWRVFNDQGTDGGERDGQAEIVVDEGRRAVKLSRTEGQGNHCETILEQSIDQPLPDLVTSLAVRATVKVRYQSLSGGGYLSSEYPLMVRLTYRDAYDSEAEWIQGFYYENTAGNPVTYGQQIPRDSWYLFESGNLLEELPIKPFKITKVRVYASGWDYESLLSDIHLIVE
ncbi:MAG: hypothetical protein A2Y73_05970 [Chloroflexi bacterium RBG_13_56_8]|nr:MAG: hypothetical protein A2Y73_05970 [Chloroflexi bacterium RBG_13_56_8]